ncbi:hypothetical protein MMI99_08615, partial [Enterococcus cecorum]|uniref:hypothetical protein n=1 Tax=Enterococcus cecorum TaxID=44008 RepID=UPI001FABEA9A
SVLPNRDFFMPKLSGLIDGTREKRGSECYSFFCCQRAGNSDAEADEKIIFPLRSFGNIIWCKGTIGSFCEEQK